MSFVVLFQLKIFLSIDQDPPWTSDKVIVKKNTFLS